MENHIVTIDNRERLTISEIAEIDSFDDAEIHASLKDGAVVIKGSALNIKALDLDAGTALIAGKIDALIYTKVREKNDKSLIAKLLK